MRPYVCRMSEYDRARLVNPVLAELEEGASGQRDWQRRSGLSIGYPAWGLLYHLTLCRLSPTSFNLVVEVGTNWGVSSIVLAQAIADSPGEGVLRTVEIDPENYQRAKEHLERAGLSSLVEQSLGDSLEQLPKLMAGEHEVAVAFLDGNHEAAQVVREFELVRERLAGDGIVIFDNTGVSREEREIPWVNSALRVIKHRFGGNIINLPFCSWMPPGMSVWQAQPFEDMSVPSI